MLNLLYPILSPAAAACPSSPALPCAASPLCVCVCVCVCVFFATRFHVLSYHVCVRACVCGPLRYLQTGGTLLLVPHRPESAGLCPKSHGRHAPASDCPAIGRPLAAVVVGRVSCGVDFVGAARALSWGGSILSLVCVCAG